MTKFTMRTTAPTADIRWYGKENPFYAQYSMFKRRLPNFIQGNCTHYAYGRFAEIHGKFIKLPTSNGGTWYKKITNLKKDSTPRVGAIIEYLHKGKTTGHLAIVEHIYENGDLLLSMSGLKSYLFKTRVVKKNDNYCYSDYKLVGFIYPMIEFEEEPKVDETLLPKTGTYTIMSNRNVYISYSNKSTRKLVKDLTANGKKHATSSKGTEKATLKKGTKVTVSKVVKNEEGHIWGKIPSGWICLISNDGTIHIK